MAHGPGTVVEIVAPLTLLFSPWPWLTVIAVAIMVGFHMFIISTFPLAVPLEWNVLFAYGTIFLFLGFPNWDGYGIADMSSPWLTLAIAACLLFFPVLGNLRPDLVSFLPAMRQYAGNWASAVWAFAPGAEEKLNRVTRSSPNQIDQLVAFGYEPLWAEIFNQQTVGVAIHAQPGPWPVLGAGEEPPGHRHPHRPRGGARLQLAHRLQLRRRSPAQRGSDRGSAGRGRSSRPASSWWRGSSRRPFDSKIQQYKVIDAALGVIERGTWKVADAVAEQPWLPNGPIPLQT